MHRLLGGVARATAVLLPVLALAAPAHAAEEALVPAQVPTSTTASRVTAVPDMTLTRASRYTYGTVKVYSSPNTKSRVVATKSNYSRVAITCWTKDMIRSGGYEGRYTGMWYALSTGGYIWAGDVRTSSLSITGVPYCGTENRLPFPGGAAYYITQGPGGTSSHYDTWNKHAIDFANGYKGGAVTAHTGGTVVFAGWTQPTQGNGIQVIVDFGNNRCAQYAHLATETVYVGQKVNRNQQIGTVGGSGLGKQDVYSPHLHFNIVKCTDKATSLQIPTTLEHGTTYPTGWTTSRNSTPVA